jgi:protein-tyrosine sulfotransferase
MVANTANAIDGPPGTRRARRPPLRHVFIVSLARSGSTLLRYLLDAHPQVVCPAELNLSALLLHAAETWHRAHEGRGTTDPGPQAEGSAVAGLSQEALRWATKIVNEIMADLARAGGASVFADKSLVTVDQLPLVARCYPKASYVFLYRYPLDMIASGIEASRWGFNSFGFAPYIGAVPGNFVGGLGNYWIDKVSRMLEFERTCSVAHARIYYELMCDDPVTTMSDLFAFLGLPPVAGIVEQAFASRHAVGPGDYKIDFTTSVGTDSVGRGVTLPELLRPEQVTRIDELLAELDYPALEAARRGNLASLLGLKRAANASAAELTRRLAERLAAGLTAKRGRDETPLPAFELVIRGDAGDEQAVMVDTENGIQVTGSSPAGDGGQRRPRVLCYGDALLKVASGERNLAQVLHDGLVRIDRTGAPTPRLRENRELLFGLDSLLRAGGPGGPARSGDSAGA